MSKKILSKNEKRLLTIIGEQLAEIIDLENKLARAGELVDTEPTAIPRVKR